MDAKTDEVIEKLGKNTNKEKKYLLLAAKDKMQKLYILLTMAKESKLAGGGEITAVDTLIHTCSCKNNK